MDTIKNFSNLFLDVWSRGAAGINFNEVFFAIKEIVEKNGASFAFPSQSLYVEKLEK